ncbi:unnamed protein product [Urochloa decumbens]|uniref:PGG domain-containing protein n=1 Tax=Urochloa decumbens TaxID=240449 RepID=A0ABC8WLC1_9POAL
MEALAVDDIYLQRNSQSAPDATRGDVATLKRLLEADRNILVDSLTPQLNTALHLAALHGHADFAREVLNVKEELLVARNADGDTPLHLAARYGEQAVAELFVRGARTWPEDLRSPLMMTNTAGDTPLHEAVRNRRSSVALLLLDADPGRGDDLNGVGEPPLEMAAREGLVLVVEKIVNHPRVPQRFQEHVRGTALHLAVLGRHIRIVEVLLEKRPELIDLTDSGGNNALHYAAQRNNAGAVKILLNERMDLAYKRNHEQQSPLHVAVHYGSTEAITALLRCCPDVAEMADNNGHNAFHASVISGRTNALRCLLRCVRPKEILNHVDKNGNTPLHLAASMSHINSALLLLYDRRIDPCILNRDGQTARSLLEIKGEMDTYEWYLWKQLKRQEAIRCRNQRIPPVTFGRAARASVQEALKQSVGTQLVIATLVATVAFAATFTMPGGYSQTDGTAIHSHRAAFKVFVVSNSIAMSCSSAVLLCFLWAPQDPVKFMVDQVMWGHRLTFLACLAMLVSFMTAVYVTLAPTVRWPVYTVIAMGASTPVFVFLMQGREVIFVPI